MPQSQTIYRIAGHSCFPGDPSAMHAAPAVEPGDDEGCGCSLSTLVLKSWACCLDAIKHD